MKILGLDPSMRAYGWAVVRRTRATDRVTSAGCIRTEPSTSKKLSGAEKNAIRLRYIARALADVIMREKPDEVVSESPAGSGNAATAVALAHTFAVTATVCELLGYDIRYVSPSAMKRDVAGALDAEKDAIAAAVERLTGFRSKSSTAEAREAEADAAGVALSVPLADLLEGSR